MAARSAGGWNGILAALGHSDRCCAPMCVTRYPTWVTDWLPDGELEAPTCSSQ